MLVTMRLFRGEEGAPLAQQINVSAFPRSGHIIPPILPEPNIQWEWYVWDATRFTEEENERFDQWSRDHADIKIDEDPEWLRVYIREPNLRVKLRFLWDAQHLPYKNYGFGGRGSRFSLSHRFQVLATIENYVLERNRYEP